MSEELSKMNNWNTLLFVCFLVGAVPVNGYPKEVSWTDILNPDGTMRIEWGKSDEKLKASYLESYRNAISLCSQNIGKAPKELNRDVAGPRVGIFYKVTPETIAMLYREYGDLGKAAEVKYKYWVSSKGSPELMNADGNPIDFVISGYEEAQMYKELADFYSQAYPNKMKWLGESTDLKLLKSNFSKYQSNWPDYANEYQSFMRSWGKAKKLAKTTKPKPLDPAVQNHEWFYSDKQEEVLKALAYYSQNKVRFMLEKALSHKDPVVAAKAKEYLGGS
jgi:hypothetical protein